MHLRSRFCKSVHWIYLGVALSVVAAEVSSAAATPSAKGKRSQPTFERDVLPLIKDYCYDCHGDGADKGHLNLDRFTTLEAVRQDRKTWEHILQNLRTEQMPPAKKKHQPTAEERGRMIHWIEQEFFPVDCNDPDPGRVTLRRLNRAEYNRTIRDLIGIDYQPAEDFPQDDVGYGFDNIGDVLSLSPVLLEKYLVAAQQVLDDAIVTDDFTRSRTWRFELDALAATAPIDQRNDGWFALVREGDVHTSVRLRADGEYVVRVLAAGEQAGPEPVKLAMRFNGRELRRIEIPETLKDAKVHEARFQAKRGTQQISVAYLNNYVKKREDRNLLVRWVEVEGPLQAGAQPLPETHRRIFFLAPDPTKPSRAAREILERFTRRAWRRPVGEAELRGLLNLFDLARKQGDSFEKSVKVALQAVLVSPHFLFRGELQPEPDNPRKTHPIGEHALASRLSYFLWSSLPDEPLSRLADRGQLRRKLGTELRRLLADPRSGALVENFAAQWLQIRNLDLVSPDPKLFPQFTEALRRDLQQETQLFVRAIIQEDRSILDFLDADFSFLNERLAALYGIEGVKGNDFRRVTFKNPERGGLLSQGSILTITSNPTRTSPVKRGKWVLETLLGAPPPPPPPNVPELKIDKDHPLTGTLRQRMEQHRANPACSSCHERMDDIGFGLENFDAIGAWRTKEGDAPLDTTGSISAAEAFKGPAELKQILRETRRVDFVRCLTEKMLTYALGRGLEYYDRCAVEKIMENLARRDYRFSALIEEIVTSVPFQKRRGEGQRLLSDARDNPGRER